MRLIDIEAVLKAAELAGKEYVSIDFLKDFEQVDAVPVVRGEWVDSNRNYSLFVMCSACKGPHFQKSKYCPNCGAKMEVEP